LPGGRCPGGLAAEGLSGGYGGRVVVRGVSLRAPPGSVTAVLGPNGSGKTTLLRLLAGLLEPREGVVRVCGRSLEELGPRGRARLVAYVPAGAARGLGQLVEEYVAAGRYPLWRGLRSTPREEDLEAARGALGRLEAGGLAGRRLGELSSGEAQRASLAHGLARGAPVLLVDEPTSFQDIRGRLLVYRVLRGEAARGSAVVVATHDFMLAGLYADRVVVLSGGRVAAEGVPWEALTPGVVGEVFRVRASWVEVPGLGRLLVPLEPL